MSIHSVTYLKINLEDKYNSKKYGNGCIQYNNLLM